MKVGALITARLKSTRLPRKVLLEVQGRPMLAHLIDRFKLARRVDEIIVCTSTLEEDAPLVAAAEREGVKSFCGHPEDVVERLSGAATAFALDFTVNVTADNPLVDPDYADRIVDAFKKTGADYLRALDLPQGVYSWGLKPAALRNVLQLKDSIHSEVYGRYFTDVDVFRVHDLAIENPRHRRTDLRMTLDYPEDMEFLRAVFDRLYRPGQVFTLDQVLDLLERHPEIIEINKHCQALYLKRWVAQSEIKLKPRYDVRRAAVIGCETIVERHIRNLRRLGVTDITTLRTPSGQSKTLDPALEVKEVDNWDALRASSPDIAVVSKPTSVHIEAARKLLPHVRGLFLEAPIAAAMDDVRSLLDDAEKARRTVVVGHSLRFHPVVKMVSDIVAGGELGDPICLQCQAGHYLRDQHPRKDLDGGVTFLLCHEIDMATALLGPTATVHGLVIPLEEPQIDADSISDLTIQHRSGAVSQIHLDFCQRLPSRFGSVVCRQGWVRFDIASPSVLVQKVDEDRPRQLWKECGSCESDGNLEMMETFLRFTREGRIRHALDLHQGAAVLQLAIEALDSAGDGRRRLC